VLETLHKEGPGGLLDGINLSASTDGYVFWDPVDGAMDDFKRQPGESWLRFLIFLGCGVGSRICSSEVR